MRVTPKDKREFADYLKSCTDAQVQGCYEKERAAKRRAYINLCKIEAARRHIELE